MQKKIHLIRFLIMLITALAVTMSTTHASAAMVKCRTDPIFHLSNGEKLTVVIEVGTSAAKIGNVTYDLHVPPGVTVIKTVYTASALRTKESYRVYQDNASRMYRVDTLVTVQNTDAVTVVTTVKLNGIKAKSGFGYNGQYVIVTVSRP